MAHESSSSQRQQERPTTDKPITASDSSSSSSTFTIASSAVTNGFSISENLNDTSYMQPQSIEAYQHHQQHNNHHHQHHHHHHHPHQVQQQHHQHQQQHQQPRHGTQPVGSDYKCIKQEGHESLDGQHGQLINEVLVVTTNNDYLPVGTPAATGHAGATMHQQQNQQHQNQQQHQQHGGPASDKCPTTSSSSSNQASSHSPSTSEMTTASSHTSNSLELDSSSKKKRNKIVKKGTKLDAKSKLEKSRQSARECRARKKLRYQYLEDLVCNREKAVVKLRGELSVFCDYSRRIETGSITNDERQLLIEQTKENSKS